MVGLSDLKAQNKTPAKSSSGRSHSELLIDLAKVDELRSDDYLVKGLIPRPGVTMIHSAPGVGKSFMALDLALTLGTKADRWCGHRVATDVKTFYVYSEGAGRLWKRRDAWLQRHDMKVEDLEGRVWILPRGIPLNGGRRADQYFEQMIEELIALDIGLLVIDTWATSNVGAGENDVKDVGPALDRVMDIKDQVGCSVVIVHHDNKAGGYRGSTGIDGVLDGRLHLQRTGKRGERTLKVSVEKQRDDSDADEWFARLNQVQLGLDQDGDPISSVVFRHVEDQEAVKKVYGLAQVAKAIWQFLQDTASDGDQDAWSKSDVTRKAHSSLIGSRGQKVQAIERMVENGVLVERSAQRQDDLGRPVRYQRLVPLVDRDGAFSELLGTLQDVEA